MDDRYLPNGELDAASSAEVTEARRSAANASLTGPLFVLAPPRTHAGVVCAMLGQHPQTYGLPETHLFAAPTMAGWWAACEKTKFRMADGLLRAVAQIFVGQQTIDSIKAAEGWLRRRTQFSTGLVYEALVEAVSPMSCEELGLVVDHLPLEMNCDGVFRSRGLRRVAGKDELHPVVLHYHQLDAAGLLPLKRIPSINQQIRRINDLIRLAERVNFDKASWLLLRQRRTA